MTISSRTPEGLPFRCWLCGWSGRMEPSPTSQDAPCPQCGALLWANRFQAGRRALRQNWVRSLFLALAAAAVAGCGCWQFGLGWQEWVVWVIIACLLFDREVPRLARWLGQRAISRS